MFAASISQLKRKYPDQPWAAVSGYTAKPFRLTLNPGPKDHCLPCQDFSLDVMYNPDDVPVTPLTVCECGHECECRPG
jgi:hypothetical protein